MEDKYILMNVDLPVGEITYNVDTRRFSYKCYSNIPREKLPIGLYPVDHLDSNYKLSHEEILDWVEDRVMPPNRQLIQYQLHALGLAYYGAWDICRRTRGMCIEDSYWLSKDPSSEHYSDLHFIHLIQEGREDEIKIPFPAIVYPPEISV